MGFEALLLVFGKVDDPLAAFDGSAETLRGPAAVLLPAGLAPRLQPLEQFLVPLFVRLGLGRDDLLLLAAGRIGRFVAEVQTLLIGRFATAFAAAAPQHIDQPTIGRLQFRHPLPQQVAFTG